jgi:ribosomal protein S18 acetylase RimI-like enzyme
VSIPAALTLRRGRADDVEAVTATLVAEEVAARGRSTWDAADTADWWRGLGLYGEAWVAEGPAGAVAGCLGLWTVAWDGEEVAGVIRGDPKRWGGGFGMLGVRRPWRRRGLGLALLRETFGLFYDRGEGRVGLGVDAENPSGATRLYERAGMHVEAEHQTWEKELA